MAGINADQMKRTLLALKDRKRLTPCDEELPGRAEMLVKRREASTNLEQRQAFPIPQHLSRYPRF